MRLRSSAVAFFLCALCLVHTFSAQARAAAAEIDEALLEKVARDSFRYFLHYTPERTGLTRDSSRPGSPCSSAAVGFYLASLPVAAENNWLTKKEAYQRALRSLTTLQRKAEHKNGFFYHFIDPHSGRRTWGSEASSIDTALVIAGALVAGEYFKGTEVERLAAALYARVDWPWMTNGSDLISHGYKPESGFIPYYWDMYSEHLIMQALAIGSPTHRLDPNLWKAWRRDTETVDGKEIVYSYSGSLFTYQFSHAFIDFRALFDGTINYFDNSVNATRANKEFCFTHRDTYKTYRDGYWGLTASVGPFGYKAYGAEPGMPYHDGTIAPYGAAASLPFTPTESSGFISQLYTEYKDELYGPCGFKDAFNLDENWFAREYLGIDQGITVLMYANYKDESIWKLFMSLEPVREWIRLCGLSVEYEYEQDR
jgi:hypothetical protein